MNDNKVSEKVIWENSITSDNDDITPTASQMHTQPQMMFCYKCDKVIPANSVFCPYCQVKLFAECPKCGVKYSSQYPICNQCGTNREEYLQLLKREQERREVVERENRRQREIQERKRLEEERRIREEEEEKERQKRTREYELSRKEQLKKEEYVKENIKIRETEEYKSTYSLFHEALCSYRRKIKIEIAICVVLFTTVFLIPAAVGYCIYIVCYRSERLRKYLLRNLLDKNGCDNEMISYVNKYINSSLSFAENVEGGFESADLSRFCIDAYRKKKGLPIISSIDSYHYTKLG